MSAGPRPPPDPATRARLVICDDHRMVTDGLLRMLELPYQVVAVVHSGTALLECLATTRADCLLLDLSLPDRAGTSLIPEIRAQWPDLKILIVTMHTEKMIADECVKRGAAGFVPKDCGEEELRRAVTTVLEGGRYCSHRLQRTRGVGLNAARPGWEHLTPRHQDILLRLGQGTSQKDIAMALGIVPATVAFHVERIRITLGFATTSELVRHAILLSVSDPPPPPGL